MAGKHIKAFSNLRQEKSKARIKVIIALPFTRFLLLGNKKCLLTSWRYIKLKGDDMVHFISTYPKRQKDK